MTGFTVVSTRKSQNVYLVVHEELPPGRDHHPFLNQVSVIGSLSPSAVGVDLAVRKELAVSTA